VGEARNASGGRRGVRWLAGRPLGSEGGAAPRCGGGERREAVGEGAALGADGGGLTGLASPSLGRWRSSS